MIRPCPIKLDGCPGADSPVLNVSAEAPDPLLFAGIGWSQYNPYAIPPLGGGPVVIQDCFNVSYSAESQALADFLALNNARACTPAPPFPGTTTGPDNVSPAFNWTPNPPPPIPGVTYQQFTNDAQTATVSCPNGAIFTYTVPAGTIVSASMDIRLGPAWVEYANALAESWALQNVWALRVCIDVPLVNRRTPTIPPTPTVPPNQIPPGAPGPNGPLVGSNPTWCCLGSEVDPDMTTYTINSPGATFDISTTGNLPPGTSLIQLTPQSAVIIGTPTTPGIYTFTVVAAQTNGPGSTIQVTDTIKVFGMVTTTLPDAFSGTPYGPLQLVTAGGIDPITFVATGLPAGFSLSPSGVLSSDNTIVSGTTSFIVQFTDAAGGVCQQTFSITVTGVTLDWNNLVWDLVSGTGGSLHTVSALGDTFDWDVQGDNSTTAFASFHGSLLYTGGIQNCALNVNITISALSAFSPFTRFTCRVRQGGIIIFDNATINPAAGLHTFNFTVGAGVNSLLEVFVDDINPVNGPILAGFAADSGNRLQGTATFSTV